MRFITAADDAPLVALVGRPNVGKSTLFNRLVRRRQALMHDEPGVTRDRLFGAFLVDDVDNNAHALRLVDTGGLVAPGDDALAGAMMAQTHMAIREAALVLLVVDARAGLLPADAEAARTLRKNGANFVVVVNKVDVHSHEGWVNEFYSLGTHELIGVSAEHARNIDEVRACIAQKLAAQELLQESTRWDPDKALPSWRTFGAIAQDHADGQSAVATPEPQVLYSGRTRGALSRSAADGSAQDVQPDNFADALADDASIDGARPRGNNGQRDAHLEDDGGSDGRASDGEQRDARADDDADVAFEEATDADALFADATDADADDFDKAFADAPPEEDDSTQRAAPDQIEWAGGPIRVAVVGRPNAGKSSLINTILGEERLVASAEAGTTRDVVDTHCEVDGQPFIFVDTAGIRRQRSVKSRLEGLMVLMARTSLERSDVVVLVLDATERPSDQDAKIAAMAHDRGCGLVMVANKWDLIENPEWADKFIPAVRHDMPFVSYAPVVHVSAKTGDGLDDLFAAVIQTQRERHRRVGTGALNRFFREVVETHPPPYRSGSRPQLTFVSQPMVRPPTFVVAAKRAANLAESYRRYLINALRDRFGFEGTPLWLKFRSPPSRSRGRKVGGRNGSNRTHC